jgi:hypothetical protein
MGSVGRLLRAVGLLSAGAIAVHQLRFVLGYGHDASDVLALEDHSYLPLAEALVAVILGAAGLAFIGSLLLASKGRSTDSGSATPFTRLWAYASTALVAVYTLQEGFEGEFSAGHPSGVVGIFGHGGWTAIPLALVVGALIALLLEGARRAVVSVRSRAGLTAVPRLSRTRWQRLPVGFPKLDVLSQHLAARGPPQPS